MQFKSNCKKCSRLAAFLVETKEKYPYYYCKPVAPFGDPASRFLIVGLAPGMHGANATGRPFTGDHAGILLYQTLYDFGFSNQPEAIARDDGLQLFNCRITNAVKCLPPANKPQGAEIAQCNAYLNTELESLPEQSVILALGKIAHDAVIRAFGFKLKDFRFGHGAEHRLDPGGHTLIDSYHCSRYNTQTHRLTPDMFSQVFQQVRDLLES